MGYSPHKGHKGAKVADDRCRYVAESYLQTDEGKAEAQRAKQEGSRLYLEAKERILRPQVAGGLVGAGKSTRFASVEIVSG